MLIQWIQKQFRLTEVNQKLILNSKPLKTILNIDGLQFRRLVIARFTDRDAPVQDQDVEPYAVGEGVAEFARQVGEFVEESLLEFHIVVLEEYLDLLPYMTILLSI